jgi:putative SOS response-associated peptidase YedK
MQELKRGKRWVRLAEGWYHCRTMCGRYGFEPGKKFFDRFNIQNRQLELKAHYNVTPTQTMPVVVQHSPNSVELMTWGFLRPWANRPLINATAEKVATSKVFSKAFAHQRCLVPASGFYEWKATASGKVPHYITLKATELFAFAGLYEVAKDKDGNEVTTYTIITTAPNELMAPIHSRMPAILHQEDEAFWLNPDNVETRELERLLLPYPEDEMQAWPVSKAVNNPRNDGEELIKPVEL